MNHVLDGDAHLRHLGNTTELPIYFDHWFVQHKLVVKVIWNYAISTTMITIISDLPNESLLTIPWAVKPDALSTTT